VRLTNDRDLGLVDGGHLPADRVRSVVVFGLVDTGATRLVLPAAAVAALGLPETGSTTVKFADGRREPRATVTNVRLEYGGRSGIFSAVVEPGRTDALIGAIVLEELDLLPDCTRKVLVPRDPDSTITEVE
jgi:predicted aspartyl protease